MSFTDNAKDSFKNEFSLIQNIFIEKYMLSANDIQLKVYLAGLQLCDIGTTNAPLSLILANALDTTEIAVIRAFEYWENLKVVEITSRNPFSVRYLKIDSLYKPSYNTTKYKDFPQKYAALLGNQNLDMQDSYRLISFLEDKHFDQNAFLVLSEYLHKRKNSQILNTSYVLKVANDWYNQGIRTLPDVENKIKDMESATIETLSVLNQLKIKRTPTPQDKDMVDKWIKLGFDLNSIGAAINTLSGNKTLEKLDNKIMSLSELGITSVEDIERYTQELKHMRSLTKAVFKNLGLFIENPDMYMDEYIKKWTDMGFDDEVILTLAMQLGKKHINDINSLNDKIYLLFSKGITNSNSLKEYIGNEIQIENYIREMFNIAGITRKILDADRQMYKTWLEDWGFTKDAINLITEHTSKTYFSMKQLNAILQQLKSKMIYSTQEIIQYLNLLNSSNFNQSKSSARHRNNYENLTDDDKRNDIIKYMK